MKRLLYRLGIPLLFAVLLFSLFRVSDRAPVPVGSAEEQPGHIDDDAVVAVMGGLSLRYEEYRYHVYQVLGETYGRLPSDADLSYDETLLAALPGQALHRAALRRAVSLMAMEAELTAPEPTQELVDALCQEPYSSPDIAFGEYSYNALSSLLFLQNYGADGALLPEADAVRWGSENGVVRLRVLWLSADPAQYHEAEIDDRLSQLRIFAAQLEKGEADFDTLCEVYSEAPKLSEGLQLLPSCEEQALYRAAAAVSESEYTVCETENAVCLVLRVPLLADAPTGDSTLRSLAAHALFSAELNARAEALTVKYRRIWKKIRLNRMF